MIGGRKTRSNKGKKRGPRTGVTRSRHAFRSVKRNNNVKRHTSGRKVRSNKGKKRRPYGQRTGITRSKRKFRGGAYGH